MLDDIHPASREDCPASATSAVFIPRQNYDPAQQKDRLSELFNIKKENRERPHLQEDAFFRKQYRIYEDTRVQFQDFLPQVFILLIGWSFGVVGACTNYFSSSSFWICFVAFSVATLLIEVVLGSNRILVKTLYLYRPWDGIMLLSTCIMLLEHYIVGLVFYLLAVQSVLLASLSVLGYMSLRVLLATHPDIAEYRILAITSSFGLFVGPVALGGLAFCFSHMTGGILARFFLGAAIGTVAAAIPMRPDYVAKLLPARFFLDAFQEPDPE